MVSGVTLIAVMVEAPFTIDERRVHHRPIAASATLWKFAHSMCNDAQRELGCPAGVSGRRAHGAHLRGRPAPGGRTHHHLPPAHRARDDAGCAAVLPHEYRLYADRSRTQ